MEQYRANIHATIETNQTARGLVSKIDTNANTNDPDPVTREALYRASGDCASETAKAQNFALEGTQRRLARY